MKNKILKSISNRKVIHFVLLLALLCVYFIFGSLLSYKIKTYESWNVYFGTDVPRIVSDFFTNTESHYRTKVHPVYIICIQPFVKLLNMYMKNPILSILFLQSLVGVLNVALVYYILGFLTKEKSRKTEIIRYSITFLFAFSFTQLVYTAVPESFIFGGFSLLVYWVYFIKNYRKPLDKWYKYLLFSLVCTFPLTITTTNFMCVVVSAPFFILYGCKKNWKDFFIRVLWLGVSFALPIIICSILSEIQLKLYPTSEPWWRYLINVAKDALLGTESTEEMSYVNGDVTLKTIKTLILTIFGYSIFPGKISNANSIFFTTYMPWQKIVFVIVMVVGIYCIYSIIKNKKFLVCIPMLGALAIQLAFHCIFGANEAFLYSQHIIPLIVILLYFGLIQENTLANKIFNGINLWYVLVASMTSIYMIFETKNIAQSHFFVSDYNVFLGTIKVALLIIGVALLFLVITYIIKYKKFNIVTMIGQSLALISIIVTIIGGSHIVVKASYYDHVYYMMGMGLRNKYIIEGLENDVTIKNYQGEVLYENLKIDVEDIDYFNYIIEGKTENNKRFKMYENETGVHVEIGREKINLEPDVHINIPTFEGYSQSLLMKRYFHELMLNILPTGPTPNIFHYKNVWYRDAAIMAMAIEKTGNISQIMGWLNSIDKMYDNQRQNDLNESDNLGNVLYLQSLATEKNEQLISDILKEAERITVEGERYISGITDGSYMPLYQTRWLKFGMKSLGLDDSKYVIPDVEEQYAALMWFDGYGDIGAIGREELIDNWNDEVYPYLRFAKLHFYKEKVDITCNKFPCTNELVEDFVLELHGWHAAEVLLYLYDYDNF